ncbi:MAG: hypothetical protein M3O85_08935, partial [Acidobacteriota bacterium]|nr:hypothetical protein [Acidobacteriota bacterium]
MQSIRLNRITPAPILRRLGHSKGGCSVANQQSVLPFPAARRKVFGTLGGEPVKKTFPFMLTKLSLLALLTLLVASPLLA